MLIRLIRLLVSVVFAYLYCVEKAKRFRYPLIGGVLGVALCETLSPTVVSDYATFGNFVVAFIVLQYLQWIWMSVCGLVETRYQMRMLKQAEADMEDFQW